MFDMLLWHMWKVFALIASVIVSLAGCAGPSPFTTTVTGTPVAQEQYVRANSPANYSSDAAAPSDSAKPTKPGGDQAGRELAPGVLVGPREAPWIDAHRTARLVDPCALHDVAAAEAAAGMGPDALMPSPNGLHMCELTMSATARDLPAWSLMTVVGVKFDEARRAGYAPVQVGGMDVFHEVPRQTGDAQDDRTCRYVRPFGPDSGIELVVRSQSGTTAAKKPCDVAQAYLAAVAKLWAEPAMRDDKVSTPALALGGIDPCVGVIGAAREGGTPLRAQLPDPYTCMATAATDTKTVALAGLISVELGVEADPRTLINSPAGKAYKPITVAGRTGVVRELETKLGGAAAGQIQRTCHVTVVADDKTTLRADQAREDSAKTHQVIKTMSGDCAVGVKAIEAVLATLR